MVAKKEYSNNTYSKRRYLRRAQIPVPPVCGITVTGVVVVANGSTCALCNAKHQYSVSSKIHLWLRLAQISGLSDSVDCQTSHAAAC
jgi:hypothetical protein